MSGLWTDLGKAGFIGINVPAEFGGGGAGMAELAMVAEESAAAGCPLLTLLVSSAIGVEILRRHGSAEQQQEWLTRLADGSTKVVFAITEPDAGSNSHLITTTARRDGDDYLICGQKYYISGVDEAAAIITVTRTGTDPVTGKARAVALPGSGGRTRAELEPARGGGPDPGPAVHRLLRRGPGAGHRADRHRGQGLGAAVRRVEPRADHRGRDRRRDRALRGRHRRGICPHPERLGPADRRHQAVSHPLAKAKIQVELAALMTAKAAWLHDQGLPAGEASNMAKYAAAEAATAAVDAAIQVHGGNGLSVEYGLMPLWGMARLLRIAPVNSEMVLNYVAQHTLKLPRSY